ncbi:MAG TPA: hypothetical protein VFS60_07995 [Thermoanaerobaculia bacterium]|nr:hypothetical protein [Thermoanaerobaculia bacterium]
MTHTGMPHGDDAHGRPSLDRAQVAFPREGLAGKLPLIAGGLGVVLLAVAFVVGKGDPAQLFRSYLLNWVYFCVLGLGGLFFTLLHHLTRAGWSVVVRRLAEAVAATLPVLALLFVPLAFGVRAVYPWASEAAAHDPVVAHKSAWLAPEPFLVRAALYLVIWSLLGWWFWRQSERQDRMGAVALTRRMQSVSAPAMMAFGITLTLAAFDWIMSLTPRWYSTVFGGYLFGGLAMSAFALLIVLALLLQRRGVLGGVVTMEHFHDLGKLMFAFVVFWSYIAFSQFMLQWYANIPEEANWFAERLHHGWLPLSQALVIGHFAVPFFFLLMRDVKRHRGGLWASALWLLLMEWLDLYWLIMPGLYHEGPRIHLLDVLFFLALGAVFVGTLAWTLRGKALVPVNDPRLAESLAFENS